MNSRYSAHIDTFAVDNLPPDEQWPKLVFSLPGLAFPERLNCARRVLDDSAVRFGAERTCLIGQHDIWTYGDLVDCSNRIARVLVEDLGVIPGNRVLLCGPNSPWQVACWFAIVKAGAVAVTVLPVLRSAELTPILESARISHALCDARTSSALLAAVNPAVRVCTFGADGDLGALCAGKQAGFTVVDTAADDVCMIAFTSGTTGKPKGCLHFHRDVLAIAETFSRQVLRPEAGDVFAGSPPLAFTFGLGALVVFPLLAGASTVLLPRGSPTELLAAITEHHVTTLFTAPTAYRAMLAEGRDADYRSLRTCVSAGEHLDAGTMSAWRARTGARMINGIGATELLHIFLAADSELHPAGSTGCAVPGVQARIFDQEGAAVPDGEAGLLAVRGPIGCRYLADERQRDYVRHGWNLTGDIYIRDGAGVFWYQSRTDDMIISAGYNIAAHDVEDALLRCPLVEDTAVIGVPDSARGQLVTAFVVAANAVNEEEDTVTAIQDFVKNAIAPYKYPRAIHFVDKIPRTPTGKIQRFQLRELGARKGVS